MSREKKASLPEPHAAEVSPSPTIDRPNTDLEISEKNNQAPLKGRTDSTASTVNGDIEAQNVSESDSHGKTPQPVKVPRSERRGLLASLCLLSEIENARTFPRGTKWALTLVVAGAAIAAPVGSAIMLPSLGDISRELHASPTVTNLCVALYMLGLGIFPVWWSFFSETYGRRSVYIVSFSLFVLWNILTAVSPNIAMLIIMRTLAGGASGSVQAVGAGTVADMWDPKERGTAMGIFYLGPLMGPLLSPIIGGALQIKWHWRSTAWFMVIYGGFTLLTLILVLPETLIKRRDITVEVTERVESDEANKNGGDGAALTRSTTRQTVNESTKKASRFLKMAIIDPLLVVRYLRFPAVALCVFYAGITFACLYVLQISIQATFSASPYNFSPVLVGCTYLFNSVGYVLASWSGGRWNDHIMLREARRLDRRDPMTNALIVCPEDRMRENAYLAGIMYPAALLWYGWAARYQLPWPAVLTANLFFGLGSMIVFGLITTMLTEFMPRRSSSGVALNNLVRNIVACVGIFVCQPLLDAIGNGWLFTATAILTLAAGAVVPIMGHYAPRWRRSMDEALRRDEEREEEKKRRRREAS